MKNISIYSRVSTNDQDFQRQTTELKTLIESENNKLVGVYEEKISGFKKNEDRKQLTKLLNDLDNKKIEKVYVWEMSRLGRNVIEVLKTIEILNSKKISLYIKNYNLETLDDKLNPNPLSMFMIQILTSVSQMERDQIKQRMKSGYDNHINNGGKVGRLKGVKETDKEFLEKHKDVAKLLKQGISVRNISKLTDGKSSATIIKVKKLIDTHTT
jgi:DNA invertase Pin-like site-specific DNA recombinase